MSVAEQAVGERLGAISVADLLAEVEAAPTAA
jgi:hypothetical protein